MTDILREADEMMQRERMARLWREYGPTLALAAVLMILATGAGTAWRTYQLHRHEQETAKLIGAWQDKEPVAAMAAVVKDLKGNPKTIARMIEAGKLAEAKKFAEAQISYDTVANDKDAVAELRDLATILSVRAGQLAKGDGADYKILAARLLPVAHDKDSAFQLLASLDAATIYGEGLKDYARALDLLKVFGDEKNPAAGTLQEKATALEHIYQFESKAAAPQGAKQ